MDKYDLICEVREKIGNDENVAHFLGEVMSCMKTTRSVWRAFFRGLDEVAIEMLIVTAKERNEHS